MNQKIANEFIYRELRLSSRLGSLIAHGNGNGIMAERLRKQHNILRGKISIGIANARLIAAAPTMEVALRSVLVNLALAQKEGRDVGIYGRLAIKAAEAAIEKAEEGIE